MNKLSCIFIFIFGICLAGCSFMGDDYVLSVDGEKISVEEYEVYLDEQVKSFENQGGSDIWQIDFDGIPAKEVAKKNAVNSLVMVKAAVAHADQLGVSLNDDEKDQAHITAAEMDNYSSNSELYDRIMEEVAVQSKVFDDITGSYQLNDEEFEAYLESYYEQNKSKYTKYTAKEIFIQATDERYSSDDVQKRFGDLNSASDFDEFAAEVMPDSPNTAQELEPSLYSADVMNQLASASVGSIIMAEDTTGYHIFYVVNITQIPIDSIREEVKQTYIDDKKQEIYNSQNSSWTSAMKIETNTAVYDSIDVEADTDQDTTEQETN